MARVSSTAQARAREDGARGGSVHEKGGRVQQRVPRCLLGSARGLEVKGDPSQSEPAGRRGRARDRGCRRWSGQGNLVLVGGPRQGAGATWGFSRRHSPFAKGRLGIDAMSSTTPPRCWGSPCPSMARRQASANPSHGVPMAVRPDANWKLDVTYDGDVASAQRRCRSTAVGSTLELPWFGWQASCRPGPRRRDRQQNGGESHSEKVSPPASP